MKKNELDIFKVLAGGFSVLFVSIIISIVSLSSSSSLATSYTASVTVSDACTLSISGGGSYAFNINGGTSEEIEGSTITTLCNDNGGYAIYAIGFSNNTLGNTNMISTSDNLDIITGTETSGNTSNWSMKLSTVGSNFLPTIDNSYGSYKVIPNHYTKVAYYNSSTVNPNATTMSLETNGSSIKTHYKAYMSGTQSPGDYVGKVKYVMVHPMSGDKPLEPEITEAGCIRYYKNGGNVEGTMGCQTVSSSATRITLLASNYSRDGYGFAGWSDVYDYATNPNANFYGPQEDITFTAGQYTGQNNGLSLYAVWIKSVGNLQDSAKVSQLCGSGTGTLTQAPTNGTANLSSVSALTDERDNQTYAIARLADNKCWMIENLRLENTATTGATNIALAQGYNSSFTGLADPESADFSNSTTANSLYSTDGSTENTISGNYQGYRFPRYNNFNTQQRAENTSNTNVNTYSYGNYYTWAAAIADTTHYNTNTNTSICPTGWRLPRGNTTASGFGKLDVDMGGTGVSQSTREASNRWRKYPNNFLYSGSFSMSSAYDRGSLGYYWSSTANTNVTSCSLDLDSVYVDPGAEGVSKYFGQSIRCTVGS